METILLIAIAIVTIFRGIRTSQPWLVIVGFVASFAAGWTI